jgi:hypothetical protein
VRRKHHRAVVGHLIELIDEYRAKAAQSVDDKAIVNDFVADVDRRAVALERQLDETIAYTDLAREDMRQARETQRNIRRVRPTRPLRLCRATPLSATAANRTPQMRCSVV